MIDRPFAALRELMDNAIDSGAKEVTAALEGGGIRSIRVTDDGCGMTPEDLEACWLPHATSKIVAVDDLEKVTTLGFRGEALSSLAACSRLEITTARSGKSLRLSVHGGKSLGMEPHPGAPGTSVSVKDLFFNMPARRRFLKSERAETTLCRRTFLEKAAAHPSLTFRLFIDGALKLFLPASNPAERIEAAWPRLAPVGSWWCTTASGDGFDLTIIHTRPEISRKDRQYIQIYANKRRIEEFSLVQALAFAYDAWMPGGAFPPAFLFIDVDPSLVDFNIHPAKKEARFRDLSAIRHRLIEAVKDKLTAETYEKRARNVPQLSAQAELLPSAVSESNHPYQSGIAKHRPKEVDNFVETARVFRNERFAPVPPAPGTEFRYLGQVMGVFLVAESEGALYIVDQHAAHERILYDRFRTSKPESEQLLIPRRLDLDQTALMRLELRRERLAGLGLVVESNDEGEWFLTALPRAAADLEDVIVEFIESGAGDAEGLEKSLWADLACKAAVKDNSVLDDDAAGSLLSDTFALETPRCPHGRPLWFRVSRRELFELVGRTV